MVGEESISLEEGRRFDRFHHHDDEDDDDGDDDEDENEEDDMGAYGRDISFADDDD